MLPVKFLSLAGSRLLRTSANPIRQLTEHNGLVGLASNLFPTGGSGVGALMFFQTRQTSRHGGNKNFRKDFNILKEPPVGPHMKLAPGVKHDGRIGANANYRHIVHYPEDGKYTIKKLPMTKLAGRDPVTGRKVIQGFRGGAKRKFRWIDWRRMPIDWDPNGPDLVSIFAIVVACSGFESLL